MTTVTRVSPPASAPRRPARMPRWLRGEYDEAHLNVPVRWLHGMDDPVITPTLLRDYSDRFSDFHLARRPIGSSGRMHRMASPRAGDRTSRSATAHLASPPSPSLTRSARGCPDATSTSVRLASSSSTAPNGPGTGASSARSALPHQREPSPAVGAAWCRARPEVPRHACSCASRALPN